MTRKLRPGAYPAKVEAGDENPAAALLAGVRAVLFDLDGTLVDSTYDWPAIRAQLGVTGASIIDQLNGLPEPERGSRWAELEAIEARATDSATLQPGTHELLDLLAENGLPTALVTNNNQANTRRLLDRFGLDFDLVLTRDDGLWKPSGAPFAEAARRLGLPPGECLGVGDSHYDVLAARDAGLRAVCMVNDGASHCDGDLNFADIQGFVKYLRVGLD